VAKILLFEKFAPKSFLESCGNILNMEILNNTDQSSHFNIQTSLGGSGVLSCSDRIKLKAIRA